MQFLRPLFHLNPSMQAFMPYLLQNSTLRIKEIFAMSNSPCIHEVFSRMVDVDLRNRTSKWGRQRSTCSYICFLNLSRGCQRVFVLHNAHKGIERNDSYNESLWSNARYVDTERSLQGKISSIVYTGLQRFNFEQQRCTVQGYHKSCSWMEKNHFIYYLSCSFPEWTR